MSNLLKRSPHFPQHVAYGATEFFNFAGWEMPTHFTSLEEEVKACRSTAVLFDGHAMGEVYVKGPDALKAVQRICVNDIGRLKPGRCIYTGLCNEDGGLVDDLVVFCLSPDEYLLTIAAFNLHKTPQWIESHVSDLRVCVNDRSSGVTCLEVQGPAARNILQSATDADVSSDGLRYFGFTNGNIAGVECMIARLGVTGELGYEIFYEPGHAYRMYDALAAAGKDHGLQFCGNKTVATFRMEKVYHIYTKDIDESTNPLEAGLGWTVKFDKGEFIGRDALLKVRDQGVSRQFVGFNIDAGGAPIGPGAEIRRDGSPVGKVTSAGYSPTLDRSIGLGYVLPELAAEGTTLTLASGSDSASATVTSIPFFDPKGTRVRV